MAQTKDPLGSTKTTKDFVSFGRKRSLWSNVSGLGEPKPKIIMGIDHRWHLEGSSLIKKTQWAFVAGFYAVEMTRKAG